ncbi:MAG: Crp/Fnr family transcriptional regulator [Bacteroidota bacterium]
MNSKKDPVTSEDDCCQECGKTADCFQALLPEEQTFLDSRKTHLTYLRGETIFKQGAFAPYILYMVSGLARIYLQADRTRQVNIRIVAAGDFMAFSSIFGENVYNCSAVAIKDATVCMIDKTALKQLFMQNASFAMRILNRNCSGENRYLELIHNLSAKQMRGKLASALLYLSDPVLLQEEIFQYLSRQDIADFASITAESATRYIREFEKEGILGLNGKDVQILDRNRLEEINRLG